MRAHPKISVKHIFVYERAYVSQQMKSKIPHNLCVATFCPGTGVSLTVSSLAVLCLCPFSVLQPLPKSRISIAEKASFAFHHCRLEMVPGADLPTASPQAPAFPTGWVFFFAFHYFLLGDSALHCFRLLNLYIGGLVLKFWAHTPQIGILQSLLSELI